MNIEKYNNNGIDYLRLSKSHYDSKLKRQKRTVVKSLGPLSRFDDGQPEFLKRLRTSYKQGSPIIDELLPYVETNNNVTKPTAYTLTFENGSDDCVGDPKLFSDVILNHVFTTLGLSQLFASIKSNSKIKYDLTGLVRLMCFGRILEPASKLSTFGQRDKYYSNICKSDDKFAIYKALDVIAENRTTILKKINNEITRTIGRNTELVFYDVTNFFFEIQNADDEELVDDELVKGLRQRGVSKENSKDPIVQAGLFMDTNGIPITIEAFAGNTLDQATLRPATKKTIDKFNLSRFILVSDRGMMSGPNIAHLQSKDNGYIISKSIKKTSKKERNWILEQNGYIATSYTFKYKSRIVNRTITDENGKKHLFKQKVVVCWSKKFYDKEMKEHQSFLEFVEAFRANPQNFRVSKTQQGYLKRFMKKEFMNKLTGEVIRGNELVGFIDEDKLSKNTEFYGYYQIVSSELDMSEEDIIEKYHGLSQIGNQFRVMKTTLNTRPMYVSKRERIEAHLTICLIALIMLRVIQHMIKKHPHITKEDKLTWHEGLSADRIQKALNNFCVDVLPQNFYRFSGISDKDLNIILESFNLNIEKKLYSSGDLRKIPKQLSRIS